MYLSRSPPNMNFIGEVCDSLETDSLTTFIENHWATGGLWVNSTLVKGGIIGIPLFAALLSMTPTTSCAHFCIILHNFVSFPVSLPVDPKHALKSPRLRNDLSASCNKTIWIWQWFELHLGMSLYQCPIPQTRPSWEHWVILNEGRSPKFNITSVLSKA